MYVCMYVCMYVVTCTAFPHVTLHSQPFPYQTGCCSVYYTCDLSRVTDFARCRLFAQLGHTLELAQVTDDSGHSRESISLLPASRSYRLMIELYGSGVKLLCQETFACLTLWTSVTYILITLC